MATFKLTLAYDGAEFSGWQAQPGQRTVQGELERAWLEITGEVVRVDPVNPSGFILGLSLHAIHD